MKTSKKVTKTAKKVTKTAKKAQKKKVTKKATKKGVTKKATKKVAKKKVSKKVAKKATKKIVRKTKKVSAEELAVKAQQALQAKLDKEFKEMKFKGTFHIAIDDKGGLIIKKESKNEAITQIMNDILNAYQTSLAAQELMPTFQQAILKGARLQ